MLTARALAAPRAALSVVARGLSTTAVASAGDGSGKKLKISNLGGGPKQMEYKFDDATTLEHRRRMGLEDSRELISRATRDAEALKGGCRSYSKTGTGARRRA